MMGFLKNIAINCEQATQLAEKSLEGKLSWSESLGFRIHLHYCSLCRLFVAQTEWLSRAAKLLSQKVESEKVLFPLSNSRKTEMATQISGAIDKE